MFQTLSLYTSKQGSSYNFQSTVYGSHSLRGIW